MAEKLQIGDKLKSIVKHLSEMCIRDRSIELKLLAEAINPYLYTLPAEARNTFVGRYYFADPIREVADYYGCLLYTSPPQKTTETIGVHCPCMFSCGFR